VLLNKYFFKSVFDVSAAKLKIVVFSLSLNLNQRKNLI
jgi:hypothetical protein